MITDSEMKKIEYRMEEYPRVRTTHWKMNPLSEELVRRINKTRDETNHVRHVTITRTVSSPIPRRVLNSTPAQGVVSHSSFRGSREMFNNLTLNKQTTSSAIDHASENSNVQINYRLHSINEGKVMSSLDSNRSDVRKVQSMVYERPSVSNSQLSRTSSLRINTPSESSVHHLIRFFNTPLYQHFYIDIQPERLETHSKAQNVPEVCTQPEADIQVDHTTKKSLLSFENSRPLVWGQIPQVIQSGILDKLSPELSKVEHIKFEILTSEASYYSSLAILEMHFACSLYFYKGSAVISTVEHKYLFGNVPAVRKVSEKLVLTLNKCFEKSFLMEDLPFLILKEVNDGFRSAYINYCRNIHLVLETHEKLSKGEKFSKALATLEASKNCQNLKLNSFLILPVQRILRLSLLIEAIISKLPKFHRDYKIWQDLIIVFKKISDDCDSASGEVEDIHKKLSTLNDVVSTLHFPPDIKPLSLLSANRSLLLTDNFSRHSTGFKLKTHKHLICLFLFSDYLLLTKIHSHRKEVIDYCAKDQAFMEPTLDKDHSHHSLKLTLQLNHEMKTKEIILDAVDSDTKEKWLKALPRTLTEDHPHLTDEHDKIKSTKHHHNFLSMFHR